jgi:hypothetical protein
MLTTQEMPLRYWLDPRIMRGFNCPLFFFKDTIFH